MKNINKWFILLIVLGVNTSFSFPEIDVFTMNQIKTIVLDPGHGGKDPGTSGTNSKEKDVSLEVVLKIEQLLKAHYPNQKKH